MSHRTEFPGSSSLRTSAANSIGTDADIQPKGGHPPARSKTTKAGISDSGRSLFASASSGTVPGTAPAARIDPVPAKKTSVVRCLRRVSKLKLSAMPI